MKMHLVLIEFHGPCSVWSNTCVPIFASKITLKMVNMVAAALDHFCLDANYIQSFLYEFVTMHSRGKGRRCQGGAVPATRKKRSWKAASEKLPLLKNTAILQKSLSEQMEALNIMDILIDISCRLQATEPFMQEAQKEESVAATKRTESLPLGRSEKCCLQPRRVTPPKIFSHHGWLVWSSKRKGDQTSTTSTNNGDHHNRQWLRFRWNHQGSEVEKGDP